MRRWITCLCRCWLWLSYSLTEAPEICGWEPVGLLRLLAANTRMLASWVLFLFWSFGQLLLSQLFTTRETNLIRVWSAEQTAIVEWSEWDSLNRVLRATKRLLNYQHFISPTGPACHVLLSIAIVTRWSESANGRAKVPCHSQSDGRLMLEIRIKLRHGGILFEVVKHGCTELEWVSSVAAVLLRLSLTTVAESHWSWNLHQLAIVVRLYADLIFTQKNYSACRSPLWCYCKWEENEENSVFQSKNHLSESKFGPVGSGWDQILRGCRPPFYNRRGIQTTRGLRWLSPTPQSSALSHDSTPSRDNWSAREQPSYLASESNLGTAKT